MLKAHSLTHAANRRQFHAFYLRGVALAVVFIANAGDQGRGRCRTAEFFNLLLPLDYVLIQFLFMISVISQWGMNLTQR